MPSESICIACGKADCEAAPCPLWEADFLRRWGRIYAFGQTLRQRNANPCDSCPMDDLCTVPCPVRLAHWDYQMALLRKQVGM